MTSPSHPRKAGNPFARPSIWPPMPETAFRLDQTQKPAPKPVRRSMQAGLSSIFAGSAVPLANDGRRAGIIDSVPLADVEPPALLAPVSPPEPRPLELQPRPLPQTAPPIPQPRPIPDGPVFQEGRRPAPRNAGPRRSGPPILALVVASLSGGVGLAALFLLLGHAAQPKPAEAIALPESPPAPRRYTSLAVGQVYIPAASPLRGPAPAALVEDAAVASPATVPAPPKTVVPVAAAPVLALAPPPPARPAPVMPAPSVTVPPPAREPVREPARQPARALATAPPPPAAPSRPARAASNAPLPRLTGPVDDEPFLTVTTRRIGPPAASAPPTSAADAQALADAPFAAPRRPAVPAVPYVRPPQPSADEPISTTRSGAR